jgi:CubicO group peptidase (beta-lactamase class C family)
VQVGSLREIVREARARTGVPGVAAGILRDGEVETCADGVLQFGSDVPVRPETPFRVASISKPFTASLAVSSLPLDEPLERWLSHTAGFRCESETPLPP